VPRSVDALKLVLGSITSQPARSLLTVFGIAVGLAAIVLLTALGEGVRAFVLGEFTQFGTHILAVTPGKNTTFGISGASIASVRPLTVGDAVAVSRMRFAEGVVPLIQGNAEVRGGGRRRRTNVVGVGPDLPAVWRMAVSTGSFLPPDPLENPRALAVLGSKLRTELFGTANPLGARVQVGGHRFRVMGVMASKGQMLGFDLDDMVYIPVRKASEIFDREGLMELDLLYNERAAVPEVVRAVSSLLVRRHGQEDFTVITQDRMLSVLGDVLDVLTACVAGIGAISLMVGAFGIVTIMTIAVGERTAEIGLLRALGATRATLRALFLAEAAFLGVAGGMAGIGAALAVVGLAKAVLPAVPLALAWPYVVAGLLSSLLLGAAAGVWPAERAAGLDPVTALREE